jgi:hypothetical protein
MARKKLELGVGLVSLLMLAAILVVR